MYVNTTKFRKNPNYYYNLSVTEDVYITVKGEVVAMLTNPYQKRLARMRSVYGIIPAVDDETEKALKMERLLKKISVCS
ncbi:MAG: type II toxin-antitoxin system prevent-host-death family antitoxin [Clostridia bacterium]|nr:type II toxin-antitoxin system prevent-host-death family antitoxin [Clostridia bacterium]